MPFRKGLSANRNDNFLDKGNLSNILQKSKIVEIGRVKDIILNTQYPQIEKYGGSTAIGNIFFEFNNFISPENNLAKPLFPQLSSYPLVNEMVLIFKLPNTTIGKVTSNESFYYINSINLWNHPHHNAYPNPINFNNLTPSEQKTYEDAQAGSARLSTNSIPEIQLNSPFNPSQNTFIEKNNIHPLLPYAGDIIHEGRWGNSIRFGSTAKPFNSSSLNPWSNSGENGEPITLIRNGQSSLSSNEGWTSINEDINEDNSSIYLTATQQIPINVASQRYFSYTPREKETPISPSTYTGDQVIINSGRLLFNSKSDHILLSSQRTISFEALKGFNFDTPANFVIDVGTHIKLGSKDATEPLVKGETLRKDLLDLTKSLLNLVKILKVQQLWPAGNPTPDPISIIANDVEIMLNRIKTDFDKDSSGNSVILSKVSKTI